MKVKSHTQRAALVTGGAKRIGHALCLKLNALGFAVALHYHHSKKEAQDLAREINNEGGVCETFECDLNDLQATSTLIQRVVQRFPKLEILINGASIFEKSQFKTCTINSLEQNLNIHFKAPFILSRDFANIVKRGHIINFLDTNVVKNSSQHFAYLITKKALYELTNMLAVELAPDIRVNAIAPGFILPPNNKGQRSDVNALLQSIPLRRKGEVSHVTKSVEFLLSHDYLNGQIIFNDGGQHLT